MIRKRLIVLFVLQITLVLAVSGIYLRYHLQIEIEKELGSKLSTLASAVSVELDVSLVTLLGPGDENTRIYRNLKNSLLNIQKATQMKRIVVMTPAGGIWVDTQEQNPIGAVYVHQRYNQSEFESVLAGYPSSSLLFKGFDGRWYKSGYAPLRFNERIVGIVAVEGSAEALDLVSTIQKNLMQIGFFALFLSLLLALFTSKRLTAPLLKLQKAAQRFARGQLNQAIVIDGKDETAFLAQTMEEMRKAILQRDEQQKAMLAGIAHEIRNPLGGIELVAGLLYDELTDRHKRSNAAKILKETKTLKNLIQNFLDYAKPIVVKREECYVKSCWENARSLLAQEIKGKNIDIRTYGDAHVYADPQHLKQIFLNLALNSIQASARDGQITVTISTTDNRAVVDFADTGGGIAPEIRARIFEPFFSSKETGLGLGLALVKNLVEQNSGMIEIKSSGKSGTVFRLSIPIWEKAQEDK